MPPNSAPAIRNVDPAAALKPVARKSLTSMSGRSANQAWRTKRATSTMPATIGTHAIGAVMPPCVSVSDRPNTMPASPGDSSRSPVQSSRPASARPASACSSFPASPSARIAIGMFTKKIHRHDALSTISPPMTGPKIGPSSVGTPDDRHHAAEPVRPGGLREGTHADRHDHAAAEALQDAEEDQRARRPGQAAQRRAEPEQGDRDHPDLLRAEALGHPPGERDDDREAQHVAGRDPLDRVQRGVELARQRLERDVDDRRVEDIDMITPTVTTTATTQTSRPSGSLRSLCCDIGVLVG